MEHKTIENINIERSKELFEYEMTEVLLKLKGEFAVVSGKDTHYRDVAVDAEDLNIDIAVLPEVEHKPVQLQVPSTDISEIEIEPVKTSSKLKTEFPIVPQFDLTMPQRKEYVHVNVRVPATPITTSGKIPDVVAKPFYGAVPEINRINMPIAVDNNDTLVSVIAVTVPKTSDRGYSYKIKDTSINYQNKAIFPQQHIEGTIAPSICQFSIKPINMKTPAVNLPHNISFKPRAVMPKVSAPEKPALVGIPKTQITPQFSPVAVKRAPITTVAPNTTIRNFDFNKAVVEDAVPVNVKIPSLKVPRMTAKEIDRRYEMLMPDINTQINCKNSILKIAVKSHSPAVVLSAPNYSTSIEDILKSVTKA